ncbi:MAG TPA: hypothetical protein VMS71_03195 [Candidatus Acidoferrum sp.]|nr:hypothetical protein [Candidatus Acidoferrum sp.]
MTTQGANPLSTLMSSRHVNFRSPSFSRGIIIIVGGYGSGKSEISVNLARLLAQSQQGPVTIADLDIINPYFRSREAAAELEAFGVTSLVPAGAHAFADLPIIIPDIRSAIEQNQGKLILDVGGDDVGARVLSSLADAFVPDTYEMLLVLNGRRPFTADVAGSMRMIAEIEASSRLKFTGIISNTHLMTDTSPAIVLEGVKLARDVARETGLRIAFVSAMNGIVDKLDADSLDLPVLRLDRALVKPWEPKGNTWTDKKLRIR